MAAAAIVGWLLENPEVGWVVTIGYLVWEIRGPKGAIKELKCSIQSSIVVIRALARTQDEIETSKVDDYLTQNGSEPSDFIDMSPGPDGEDEDNDDGEGATPADLLNEKRPGDD